MAMWSIWDLDGVLASLAGREHFVKAKQYDLFNASGASARPLRENCDLLRFLATMADFKVAIVTARSEDVRKDTEAWMRTQCLPFDELHMRPSGDMRSDWVIKKDVFFAHFRNRHIVFAIDDRKTVCDMWRALDINTFHAGELE